MQEKKKRSRKLKIVILGLPLAAGVGSAFLPLQRFGQQFTLLIVLVWVQAFFIVECFMVNR